MSNETGNDVVLESNRSSGIGDRIVVGGTDISQYVTSYTLHRADDGSKTLTAKLYDPHADVTVAEDRLSFTLSGVSGTFVLKN